MARLDLTSCYFQFLLYSPHICNYVIHTVVIKLDTMNPFFSYISDTGTFVPEKVKIWGKTYVIFDKSVLQKSLKIYSDGAVGWWTKLVFFFGFCLNFRLWCFGAFKEFSFASEMHWTMSLVRKCESIYFLNKHLWNIFIFYNKCPFARFPRIPSFFR